MIPCSQVYYMAVVPAWKRKKLSFGRQKYHIPFMKRNSEDTWMLTDGKHWLSVDQSSVHLQEKSKSKLIYAC